MTVRITVPLGRRQLVDLERVSNTALVQAKRRILQESIKFMPIDTGRLRDTFFVDISGDGLSLEWNAPYAYDVDAGFPPHIIEPVGKEVLKFTIDGKTIFAKRVKHPGFEGHNFVQKVVRQARKIVVEEIEAAMRREGS